MLPENVDDELWVIKPVDCFPTSLDESKLEHKGGIIINGKLQLMTFPYFLRQLSRKQSTNYARAANKLVSMCSEIGMPREVRELMMEELEATLAAGNNETLRKQTEQRLGMNSGK